MTAGVDREREAERQYMPQPSTGPASTPAHHLSVSSPRAGSTASNPLLQRFVPLAGLAIAYYIGARIGFLLQSPLVPQSVLWLPNSILCAALIVAPRRQWVPLLLSAYPAQMLVGWGTHSPLSTMSLIFLTNCADAGLAAAAWRRLSPGNRRIEGLRPMLAFLVFCAALPTVLLSFADAAITVAMRWNTDYWLIFITRARANVLTNVIFVPAAVAALTTRRFDLGKIAATRWLEAALMLAGLVASAVAAFWQTADSISSAALSYVPLMFVVWAAVRFGMAMTGSTLILLAFVTTWMTVRGGMGPVSLMVANHVVPALQFELLAIAVPVLCLCAVIQDRERASRALAASQEALNNSVAQIQSLAGRLLSATEVERTRIARDLHDDINQQIAALGIGLSALKRHMPNESPLREEVARLQRQAMQTADSVRSLSHELHPAALQHAGLLPALRELCAQYGRGELMRAALTVHVTDIRVTPDVALCVYRVTQEALRNAANHSGARLARLSLRATDDMLELEIVDDGNGFDHAAARRHGGLGLTSMTERVRLVGGSVHVDTAPGRGTRIALRVPYGESHVPADASPRG